MKELLKNHQKINLSGAGTSHQNGAAERAIKTVLTMSRNMLMRNTLRCPDDTFSTDIWTMAVYYAVWVYNRIPDMQSVLSAI